MTTEIAVPRDLLEDVFDSLCDLKSEWHWKNAGAGGRNQKAYNTLCEQIEKLKLLLGYKTKQP